MNMDTILNKTIERSSWKSKDLKIMCALLNTTGGEIVYKVKESDSDNPYQSLLTAIPRKVKKIGPDVGGLIIVSPEELDGEKYVRVSVKPSSNACYVQTRSGEKTFYIYNNNTIIQTSEDIIKSSKRGPHTRKSISRLTSNMIIPDSKCVNSAFEFSTGNKVPIYEVYSVYGFNRIVGYLKYLNRTFGTVYSRGQCKLYKTLIPSLYRDKNDLQNEDKKIDILVNRFLNDNKLIQALNLNVTDRAQSRYRIEGLLQHYGATTSFLDVVDNHWVALWMGLNRYLVKQQLDIYAKYEERSIPLIDKLTDPLFLQEEWEEQLYQYVLLIAVPYSTGPSIDGINKTDDIIEIDLRKTLPSTFLRPHAQHGLVIKKNVTSPHANADDFDLASNVVAIIRIRIDRAKQWIGNGELLTQDNLIPPPGFDPGYDLLLSKYNIFHKSALKITKYI